MQAVQDGSVDLVLSDLPYGTTYATWDSVIPLTELWQQWLRLTKPKAAIVLTASQPFTSTLVMSKPELFRCEWIWDKVNGANFANANRQPLKTHESVLVFATGQPVYHPQKTQGKPNHVQGQRGRVRKAETQVIDPSKAADDVSGMKYPKSIQCFPKHSSQSGLHPTQKPVDLMRYLVRTYSNPGDTVLDNTMGSGTTGVAALLEGRKFIGMESDPKYFEIAKQRIEEADL